MNKWVFIISIALISCSTDFEKKEVSQKEESVTNVDTVVAIEKEELPIDTTVYFKIDLSIVYSQSYCSGARPSEEILDKLHKEKPYYLSEIIIRNTNSGVDKIVTTNKFGHIIDSLPRGIYKVFLSPNFNSELVGLFDPKCRKVLDRPIYSFQLSQNYSLKISHRFECDPCDPSSKMRP